ncbi:DUF2510 domain-containing protein [Propionibacteriaceae bacterium Y1923]
MAEPGWYHDPTGTERYRYWDGSSWSTSTSQELPGGRGPWYRWALFLVAGVVALAVVLTLLLPRGGTDPDTDPTEQTTTTEAPTDTQTPGATQTSRDLCTAGNGRYLSASKQQNVVHTGLAIDFPQDWGFRLDVDQFPWLEDVYPFGTIANDIEAAIIIGRQPAALPTDLTLAVQQNWLCFVDRGFLQDEGLPDELPADVETIETNGVPGAKTDITAETSQGKVVLTIRVHHTGSALVSFIGYHDQAGDTAIDEQIRTTLDTIRRG